MIDISKRLRKDIRLGKIYMETLEYVKILENNIYALQLCIKDMKVEIDECKRRIDELCHST